MFLFPLPAVPRNGGCCVLLPHLPCRLRVSSLHSRTWQPVQTLSSQRISLGDGSDLRLSCDDRNPRHEGSNAGEEFRSSFSKDFVSHADIQNAASRQGLSLLLESVGPFFRIRVLDLQSKEVLGAAQGLVKIWTCGRILHLDSVRLNPSSLKAKRPIFGIAFLLGAVAVRHGYDQNCVKAELLAINDTDTYHSKLIRYYSRLGFRSVYDVTGESLQDIPHLLIWGGVGTRMDANIEELLCKWSPALKKVSK